MVFAEIIESARGSMLAIKPWLILAALIQSLTTHRSTENRMDVDVIRQIGAVAREVTERKHEGKSRRVVAATRTYATSPEDVWDAITRPERLARWFGRSPAISPRRQLPDQGQLPRERSPPASRRRCWR